MNSSNRTGNRVPLLSPARRKTIRIVSLLDAFTILLIFLLKNFATDNSLEIALQQGVTLPGTVTSKELEPLPFIVVSSSAIIVNENTISTYGYEGIFQPADYEKTREEILLQAFRFRERYPDHPGFIIIAADRSIPSGTVKRIMAIATAAGFGKINLATVQRDAR